MAKGRKNSKNGKKTFNVKVVCSEPSLTLEGRVEETKGGVIILHRKPRSPRMLRTFIPENDVICYVAGEEGYVIKRERSAVVDEFRGVIEEVDEGRAVIRDEDGDEIVVNLLTAELEAEVEEEKEKKSSKKKDKKEKDKKKNKKDKPKRKKEEEEPDEDEEEGDEEDEDEEEGDEEDEDEEEGDDWEDDDWD